MDSTVGSLWLCANVLMRLTKAGGLNAHVNGLDFLATLKVKA